MVKRLTLSLPPAALTALLLAPLAALQAADNRLSRPNILILLADDLGYADLGVQGCRDIPTPHIDSIAKNGVRFLEAYVPAPHCVPSRKALMTGRYPQRAGPEIAGGMAPGTATGLSLEESTLADRLRAVGYASAALGKWHLGELEKFQPQNRGFDEFYGFLAGMHDYFRDADPQWGPIMDGRKPGKLEGYLTDVLGDRAVEFILRRQKTMQPWFIYLAFNAVHTPKQAREDKLKAFAHIADPKRRSYAAMLSSMDDNVGRVLAAVREAGAEKTTLIFFMSDNGGPLPGFAGDNGSLNTPLRGSKLQVWEGGIRVPFLVQWMGRLPAGRVVDGMVSSMDITATALAAAGADLKAGKPLDGLNLLPLLDGKPEPRRHPELFFSFANQEAARVGDWKWITMPQRKPPKGAKAEPEAASIWPRGGLFNLREDIGETRDLSAGQPARLKALQDAYSRWNANVNAGTVTDHKASSEKRTP